jgi:phenylacetate-CoA ligase
VTSAAEPVTALRGLIAQLERSQWAEPADIQASQFVHLRGLAEYCRQYSPFFARRLTAAGLTPAELATPAGLAALPVMTRRDLQSADDVYCRETGRTIYETRTTGSTGEPVVVRKTQVSQLFWSAMTVREHLWHERDFGGRFCVVRAPISAPFERPDWGPPVSLLASTGSLLALPIATDVAPLVARLREFQPQILSTYPTTLGAVTRYCRERGITMPALQHILTSSETLSASVRSDAEATFGARVADNYSSEEVGHIALECPTSGRYHVMAESLIVEVLDRAGRPCQPGDIGRVTITDLHNRVTPLVRYDIGDFAEASEPCACGRGLPTLARIVGRERNLLIRPDGTRYWPLTGFPRCRDVAPVLQFQFVQENLETVEARLVTERTLTCEEEDRLRTLFQSSVGYPFTVRFAYFDDRLPVSPTGKFEEFVCHVAPGI